MNRPASDPQGFGHKTDSPIPQGAGFCRGPAPPRPLVEQRGQSSIFVSNEFHLFFPRHAASLPAASCLFKLFFLRALASAPPPSPAPLWGAGERRDTLTSRGLHPRLSASRPSGACPFFLLRLCSGQALRKGGTGFSDSLSAPAVRVSLANETHSPGLSLSELVSMRKY